MKPANIQNVLAGLEPMTPEKNLKGEFDSTQTLAEILSIFESNSRIKFGIHNRRDSFESFVKSFSHLKITPNIIEEFSYHLPLYVAPKSTDINSGIFISGLIQASYDGSHNNFKVHLEKVPKTLCGLGKFLRGQPENHIQLEILGSPLHGCCRESDYLDVTIHGNVGRAVGAYCRDSTFTIYGCAEETLGADGIFECAENIILKTNSRKLLRAIEEDRTGRNLCEVYFINWRGREKRVELEK